MEAKDRLDIASLQKMEVSHKNLPKKVLLAVVGFLSFFP